MTVDTDDPIMQEYDYIDDYVEQLESKVVISFEDFVTVLEMCRKDENMYNKFRSLPIGIKTFELPTMSTGMFASFFNGRALNAQQAMYNSELVPEAIRCELLLKGLITID